MVASDIFNRGTTLAQCIGMQDEELIDSIVACYQTEHPGSASLTRLTPGELRSWTAEALAELHEALCSEEIRPWDKTLYPGDVVIGASAIISPLENYIEGTLFVARVVALNIMRNEAHNPRRAQELVSLVEDAALRIARANLHFFADNNLPAGCLARFWINDAQYPAKQNADTVPEQGNLTTRELEVLRRAADGKSNGEIAAELGIKQNTVKNHLARLYQKTGTGNRTELARWAVHNGLV